MIKSPTQRENADRTNEHHEDIENAKLIIENFISKNVENCRKFTELYVERFSPKILNPN